MVGIDGLEPSHSCEYQILSLARLPIPPYPQSSSLIILAFSRLKGLVELCMQIYILTV